MTPESLPYVVCCLGVGGSLLALLGLFIELRFGQELGKRISVYCAIGLGLVATVLAIAAAPPGLWGSVGGLALVALLARVSRSRRLQRGIIRLCNANTVWLMLLIAAPAGAWWLVVGKDTPSASSIDGFPVDDGNGPWLVRKPSQEVCGVTDRGRAITLFAFEVRQPLEEIEDAMLTARHYAHQIIQVAEPSERSNCHGWVFADGRFGVPSEQVDMILADNGYRLVDAPREDDVVVYRNSGGDVLHTGVVQLVTDEGLVLVESKWGPLGVFLHPVAIQPYGIDFGYYRTSRPNHRLIISDIPAGEPAPQSARRAQTSPNTAFAAAKRDRLP